KVVKEEKKLDEIVKFSFVRNQVDDALSKYQFTFKIELIDGSSIHFLTIVEDTNQMTTEYATYLINALNKETLQKRW
ncbi:hypothetical protein, partial [Xanthovirga aplysinae]|uniref:hypothetical protein n=1 Tax=Xanthovirga aplysinae TaxID=2529853 RepID=UPI001656F897